MNLPGKQASSHERNRTSTPPHQLVVVGSSAGGIEALSILVETLPPHFPAPVVLAQHLDPTRPSNLDQILQHHTALSVESVTTKCVLQEGHIYIVPANCRVIIHDHHIETREEHVKRPQPSIDALLSTAAQAYGENLIAAILTGTGSDGMLGAIDVKNAGGLVVIQNPQTARYPSMPLSLPPSIIDYSLDVEQIGPLLSKLLMLASTPQTEERPEDTLQEILTLVNQQAHINFRPYKTSTVLRRISRRMAITHKLTMQDYTQYVKTHPEEVGELVKALLINVTQFFRDPEAFTYLESDILPKLIEQARAHDHVLRFWTAGCATGEEPYSLAMVLATLLEAELSKWSIKIFATDLDEAAIDFARRGIYSEKLLAGVPQKYRDRFFERLDHQRYRICKTVRQIIIFGQQDLGRSASFPRIDLVLCRNVLIYFTPQLQETVLNQFALSLYPNGYLFLGKAETVRPKQTLYKLVNKQWKVYQCTGKRLSPGELQAQFSKSTREHLRAHQSKTAGKIQEGLGPGFESSQLLHSQDVFLRLLPTGVVVIDRSYRMILANRAARQLLGLQQLENDQDFLHAVPGLPYREARTAIDTVFRERESINLAEVEIESTMGENRYVSLALALVQMEAGRADLVIICITDVTQIIQVRRQLESIQTQQTKLLNDLETSNKHLNNANKELLNVNEEIQVSNEELLLTREELQSSIEEYETTNEELQAANEELETHNEEMQAANEELEATNDELTSRTLELQDLTTQLENERGRLAKMVELAPFYILVLAGPSLIVDAYNTNYVDVAQHQPIQGQPLDQVVDLFQENGMTLLYLARDTYRLGIVHNVHTVVTASPEEDVSRKHTTSYFTYTAVPSYDGSGKIDGVIIYVQDETKQQLQEAEYELERLKVIFNALPKAALALYDAQTGKLIMGSRRYLEYSASLHHLQQNDLIGRTWQELTLIPSQDQAIHHWQTALENQAVAHLAEVSNEICPGETIVWNDTLTPIMDANEPGKVRFLLALAVNITEQVQARRELEVLGNLKEEFLSLASHELRSPLTAIQGIVQLLQRRIRKQQKAGSSNTEQEQDINREVVLLDKIADQTSRMNELITEMLDATRLHGQVFELKRKEDVNIVELTRRVIGYYEQDDQQRKITLQSEQESILGMCDEKRIEQVICNLISNALKYSPTDTPIVIEVKEQSGDSKNNVIVAVHDQGPGIAEKDQARIFDRFYRANDMVCKRQEGLGLGLYISYEIVALHGGQMWVTSSPGQGSTFSFSLPKSMQC